MCELYYKKASKVTKKNWTFSNHFQLFPTISRQTPEHNGWFFWAPGLPAKNSENPIVSKETSGNILRLLDATTYLVAQQLPRKQTHGDRRQNRIVSIVASRVDWLLCVSHGWCTSASARDLCEGSHSSPASLALQGWVELASHHHSNLYTSWKELHQIYDK